MSNTTPCVVVIPELEFEWFVERRDTTSMGDEVYDDKELCKEAILESKVKAPYDKERIAVCYLYELVIQDGKLIRRSRRVYHIPLPQERMDKEQFVAKCSEILHKIPVQFHDFAQKMAERISPIDRGEYEKNVKTLQEIVDLMENPIIEYGRAF